MVNRIGSNDTYMPIPRDIGKNSANNKEFSLELKNEENEEEWAAPKDTFEEAEIDAAFTKKDEESDVIDLPFLTEVEQRVKNIINSVKGFFYDLWNGGQETEDVRNDIVNNEVEDVEQIIKSKNIDKLEQYMTENGKKKLAHNTELLTRYDYRGRIVDIEASDKNKIMHGTKSWDEL